MILAQVIDPEGHSLVSWYVENVPTPGDSVSIINAETGELVEGTVSHREWRYGPGDYVVITIEPDGWGDVSAAVRMSAMQTSELAPKE